MRVGLVGLGQMGAAVVDSLLASNFSTVVWNRTPEAAHRIKGKGVEVADTVEGVLQSDVVLSLLYDDVAVRQVFLESGALRRARPGNIHVCMSTVSVSLVEELLGEHQACGVGYVAAPVFGRPEAVAAATLNIAAAAPDHLLEVVSPVLATLGRVWRLGSDPRAAHAAKIAGNFLIGGSIGLMAEACALVRANGEDASPFMQMMTESLFASPIYRTYGPAVASGVWTGLPSGLALPSKDVALALGEAKRSGRQAPFANTLKGQLELASDRGLVEQDWSVALSTIAAIRTRKYDCKRQHGSSNEP